MDIYAKTYCKKRSSRLREWWLHVKYMKASCKMVKFLSNFNEIQYHEVNVGKTYIQTQIILIWVQKEKLLFI
jgi:hypothetical protein